MLGRFTMLALCGCVFWTASDLVAQPVIKSVFPTAAQKGSSISVEFRGANLDGVYALWVDMPGVEGEVKEAEEKSLPSDPATKPTRPVESVVMQMRVNAEARPGTHRIRLVSSSGLSNAVSFFVADQPVEVEVGESHHTAKEAQSAQVPALINGRLDKSGQLDCYSFMASEGDVLKLEMIQSQELKPQLSLLGPSSSWFKAERLERQLSIEERQSDLVPTEASGTFRVQRSGRYVVQVSSLFGQASVDASYLLAVYLGDKGPMQVAPPKHEWQERSFTREIGKTWLEAVLARSFKIREPEVLNRVDKPAVATTEGKSESGITLPAILEGTIDRPGDCDNYRLKVRAGDEIAIEIETPSAQLPAFNPLVAILDSENHEVFSNLHRKVSLFNNNAERQIYIADVMPKILHRFDQAGEYTMQVQDITASYGAPTYRYRILVRAQVPHVGEISLGGVDCLNLERGRAGRVTLTTNYEEGFTGNVAFAFPDLPAGVQAFPADSLVDRKAATQITENAQTVLAPTSETTLVLAVSPDAPLTRMPQVVRVECRVLDQQRLTPALLVRELPIMVVAERENKP